MGFRKRKNIELYESLEDLSIYRFDKIINGDLRYLAKEDHVAKIKIDDCYKEVWKKLYNEYASKTKNNTTVRIYLLIGEINYLSLRRYIVPSLVDVILSATNVDVFNVAVDEVCSWGFSINKNKPIGEEIEKVLKAINNSGNKIKRKKAELEGLTEGKKNSLSLIQQKVKLENILKLSIDIRKTSVIEWLTYWEEVELMTSKKKKALANG